jgi:formylglycine-generating enzyme required for sulfatase activity
MNPPAILVLLCLCFGGACGQEGLAAPDTVGKPPVFEGFSHVRRLTTICGERKETVFLYRHKRTGLTFAFLPGGKFTMGNADWREHEVELDAFLISTTEVTQKAWRLVMGTRPWQSHPFVEDGEEYPAVYLSWNDASRFCAATGLQLPTEAQWEYSCRAGSGVAYFWGDHVDGSYMWYAGNTWLAGRRHAQKVRRTRPNPFGLYDMSGNVWEWCRDWYAKDYYLWSPSKNPAGPESGSLRVVRGGSFVFVSGCCGSAFRSFGSSTGQGSGALGFRCVFEVKSHGDRR